MAEHPEKLTETIGVKLSVTTLRRAKAIAEHGDIGISEWVRLLIDQALEKERARYLTLDSIFGDEKE